MESCDQCGFVYASVDVADLPGRIGRAGPRYAAALAAVARPRRRPAPDVWSPLEYACHVRDVLGVQRERVALALRADNPVFTPMGRDERVVRDAYNTHDPAVVLADLAAAATALAAQSGALSEAQWDRTGVYNWPRPGPRTLRWLARHTVHEIDHHLRDVTGQNGRVTEIEVRKFAAEWVRAWNAHDVEAVLAHFADDVVFTSPVAARVVPETGGVVRGKEALRAYWNRALSQVPDLRFEVEAVYAGVSTLVIAYRNQAGGLVSEVLEFDGDKVVRGHGTALVA
jgi:ketosteroid isomerase-like protein